MTTKAAPIKVITEICTMSYPWLDKAQPVSDDAAPGTKPKYSATLVFKPGTNLKPLQDAVMQAAEAAWPGKVQEMIARSNAAIQSGQPATFRLPFRRDIDHKYEPDGCIYINCRSAQAPGLVYAHAAPGTNKPEIVPADKITEVFYPGAQVRASVTAFAYNKKGNIGVSFALNNIQKIADGPRIDSRVSADDEFTADLSQAPADLDNLLG